MMKAGIASTTAHEIMNNDVGTFRLKHIEILCKALMFELDDLLFWIPKTREIYPKNMSLRNLERKSLECDEFMDMISKMPLKKFREMARDVVERKKGNS